MRVARSRGEAAGLGARRRGACVALALPCAMALLVSCAPSAAGPAAGDARVVVLVEVPTGAFDDPAGTSLRDPYPSGARVVAWDLDERASSTRLLSGGFDAAGAPSVDHEGRRVLFVGRRERDEPWRVWSVPVDGGEPAALSPADSNATSACWLPDGRVVYASDREGTLDPRDGGPASSLWAAEADGSAATRITFGPSSEVDPSVLDDGRIAFATWQPADDGRPEGSWSFLTVAHDGTAVSDLYGAHEPPRVKRRPRQVGRRVVFLAGEAAQAFDELAAIALARPQQSRARLADGAFGTWRSAEDLDGVRLLVSQRPAASGGGARAGFGLRLLDPRDGRLETLRDDPQVDEVDAVLARRRERPRGRLSLVDPRAATGELLCLDARLTDRATPVEPGAGPATELEVVRVVPRSARRGAGAGASSGFELDTQLLGRAPLAADGSVFLEVPADTPLRLRTRDAAGRTVLESRGWIWVRPAEKRGCIGCHEDRERAPSNRYPDALAADDPRPLSLVPPEVPPR